jgi:hypothetical protein
MGSALEDSTAGVVNTMAAERHFICSSSQYRRNEMKGNREAGKIGYIILWFLGVPVSVLLLIALIRSC